MFKTIAFLMLSIFYCAAGLYCQKQGDFEVKLKVIDETKNDSLAILSLESLRNNGLPTKDILAVNFRLITRLMLHQKFSKAVMAGTESIAISRQNQLDSMEAVFHQQLGNVYYFMEQKKKAIAQYKLAIEISEKKEIGRAHV